MSVNASTVQIAMLAVAVAATVQQQQEPIIAPLPVKPLKPHQMHRAQPVARTPSLQAHRVNQSDQRRVRE